MRIRAGRRVLGPRHENAGTYSEGVLVPRRGKGMRQIILRWPPISRSASPFRVALSEFAFLTLGIIYSVPNSKVIPLRGKRLHFLAKHCNDTLACAQTMSGHSAAMDGTDVCRRRNSAITSWAGIRPWKRTGRLGVNAAAACWVDGLNEDIRGRCKDQAGTCCGRDRD